MRPVPPDATPSVVVKDVVPVTVRLLPIVTLPLVSSERFVVALAARRAAHLAAEQSAAAQTTSALRRDARDELLADLRQPASVRRAFLLREVLGTPAGLR